MRRGVPYRDRRLCRHKVACTIEEDGMNHFLAEVASQRMADMQAHAAAVRAARKARRDAPARGLRRLARRTTAVVAECNAAQRRLTELAMSTDQYVLEPDTAPDTYAEFLLRTARTLRREPAADVRLSGRLGR
jgi:hypothetical protein